MVNRCILTSVRWLGNQVYWLPDEQTLCWEDRENLVDMPHAANEAFRYLVRSGLDPRQITNADLGGAVTAGVGPSK
jgi:hypothetical protein